MLEPQLASFIYGTNCLSFTANPRTMVIQMLQKSESA